MPDENIQHRPDQMQPVAPGGAGHITNVPRPAPPGPAGTPGSAGAAAGRSPVGGWLAANLRYFGIGLAVAVVAAVVLTVGTDLTTGRVAGLSVILAIAAGVLSRAWLGTAPSKTSAPNAPDTRSEVSNTREVIETVVFVVVLVLLLKSFVAEAFVIPTGSMATTLWGYQKLIVCPQCDYRFPVNCSQEVDPQEGDRSVIEACTCPNCRFHIDLAKSEPVEERDPRNGQMVVHNVWKYVKPEYKDYNTGDRVLVGKFLYDLPWNTPEKNRLNVVVFKYPREPQKGYTPLNYIKRLVGLPGETIGIYYGKIYVLSASKGLRYKDEGVDPLHLWEYPYMHIDDPLARERWDHNEFEILRRPPEIFLTMARLVYDNDHPAKDLKAFPRWVAKDGSKTWTADDAAHTFQHAAADEPGLAWLRYRNLIGRGGKTSPELITDFMGYNSYEPQPSQPPQHWVGDLMLDCEVKIDKPDGELAFELSRGSQRFRAIFDLKTGTCTLKHVKSVGSPADDAGEELRSAQTSLKKSGNFHVRFANVDNRLLVWIDQSLPFGDEGVPYTPYAPGNKWGPTTNDLEPASLGVRGAGVTVSKIQLWRDTYYTQMHDDARDPYPEVDLAKPDEWDALQKMPPMTLYVQPGHYLCLGDNSPHSSDGRAWGLVPERLMLGRALLVYYPFPPMGANRVGPIR